MIPGANWARRYGTQHLRRCARPGCGAPATAALRFQPTQREAWLVDIDDNAVRTEGDLCQKHAATLVLPRGWRLHDERTGGTDSITRARARARRSRGASIARARRRRATRDDLTLPGLSAVPESSRGTPPRPASVEAPELDPDPALAPVAALLTEPPSDELADVLDAQTPLLRRAFQNLLPQGDDG
ncbi:MAG TPA: DUF3499 family protein [Acidimicrobiia bacterium]|nr:DUF3499 family protein [Acidimicrobiia bacterium]